MASPVPSTPPLAEIPAAAGVPSIRRRLAALVYEGVLLFGVVFIAGYLFGTLTQQRNGLTHHNLLTIWVALVVGAYFVWCWTRGGQTLPMKTWRLRLVATETGRPPSVARALARYIAAWLWFLPPLALHPLLQLSVPATLAATAAWFALWAAAACLDPARQFLHDRLAGTRIVTIERN
ncbi:RDD family protein [Trinickia sp. NRRL B-1857]|uniref:RDD family protein n=1 Tax=Trinickia sp. NRRL B-1857 TaxID=3162879 RepID=UPI003D2AFB8F